MHELNTNKDKITLYKDWYIHFWLLGHRKDEEFNRFPRSGEYDQEHDIRWCDQTDDFDYPSDLDKFCEVTGHKCTNKEVK